MRVLFGLSALLSILLPCFTSTANEEATSMDILNSTQSLPEGTFVIGNAKIERRINAPTGGLISTSTFSNLLTQETMAVSGEEFRLVLADRTLTQRDFSVQEAIPGRTDDGNQLKVLLTGQGLLVTLTYSIQDKANFLRKDMTIRNTSNTVIKLDEVWVESLQIPVLPHHVRSTNLSPVVGFLRQERGGFFGALAFPYMLMKLDDSTLQIGFPPHQSLGPGGELVAHTAVIGVSQLGGAKETATSIAGPSKADELSPGQLVHIEKKETGAATTPEEQASQLESEAWRDCIELLYPPRHSTALLMNGAFCEGNMVRLRERWHGDDVAYENSYLENVLKEMDHAAQLGFNGVVYGPGPTVWKPGNPSEETLDALVAKAKEHDLSLGLYTSSNHAAELGPFWNSFGIEAIDYWKLPEYAVVGADGKPRYLMCYGCSGFQKVFSDYYLTQIKRGFSGIWYDFTFPEPCYATNHGHVPGDVYQQIKWLMDFMQECQIANPRMVTFGFLGWGNMLPHGARQLDMFYCADPHMDLPLPGLNQDQLFGDSRRRQLRDFAVNGLPVHMMANADFFVFVNSPVPNYLTYQYTILQGLAITPNWSSWGPEFLRDTPHKEYDHAVEFIRFWNQWRKERWPILKNLKILSPPPAIGVLEAYMHTDGKTGYLFLVNPNTFTLEKEFSVNESIGLVEGNEFWLREWYPEKKWRLANDRPILRRDDRVKFQVPASTVMILEFVPCSEGSRPSVWGVPMSEDATAESFSFERRLSIPRRVAVALPEGVDTANVTVDEKTVPTRIVDGTVLFEDLPPTPFGERANPELRSWVVRCEDYTTGLNRNYIKSMTSAGEVTHFPLPSIVNCEQPDKLLLDPSAIRYEGENVGKFLGAYVYNTDCYALRGAFRFAHVQVKGGESSTAGALDAVKPAEAPAGLTDFPATKEYWAGTTLAIPHYSNSLGENVLNYAEHLYVLLPFVDYQNIAELKAWINGREAEVTTLDYYRAAPGQNFDTPYPKSGKYSYYIDGTKWGLKTGDNTLVIYTKWK